MKKMRNILIIVLILQIYIFFNQQINDIVIITQQIKDQQLSKIFSGVAVVQISDLHIEKVGLRERKLIRLINRLNPDIIFITGDFVSTNQGIEPCIKVLKQIVQGHLVVAILGNSDHYCKGKDVNTKLLTRQLKQIGIKLLVNESLKLEINRNSPKVNSFLYIVGLDDNFLWRDDIFKAMNNVPVDAPKILLAHAPNIVEKICTKGINLILSGHTHGGQIVLPFIGALATNSVCGSKKKFVSGLYIEGRANLYVNRGIGTSVLPLRLFCKPEITVFKFI